MVLTTTHQKKLASAKLALKENSIRVSFLLQGVRELKNHLDLFIVMFVGRFKHCRWVEITIFSHLLITTLDMCGFIS